MTELIRPTEIEYYGRIGEAELYIKRDDRIPFSFGGNKVRIAWEIFAEMETRGSRAVVTYGSASSNLNRVMTQMAAEKNIPCTCIIKKEGSDSGQPGRNERMVLDSGAEIVYTAPEKVHDTVAAVLEKLTAEGRNPYYVYGSADGKGGEAVLVRAYRKAYQEICRQEQELGVRFDTIVLPVGTGATLAGLVSACGEDRRILGISVANPAAKAAERVRGLLTASGMTEEEADARICTGDPAEAEKTKIAEKTEKTEKTEKDCICRITDAYLLGGYGKCSEELKAFIVRNLQERGLALDPVYSGKAFAGLQKEAEKKNVTGRCLFVHTGGLPLFYDLMETLQIPVDRP